MLEVGKIFVEIDGSSDPVPSRGDMDFVCTGRYIDIDIDMKALAGKDGAAQKVDKMEPARHAIFVGGDASELLPFAPKQVDEFCMVNLLGDDSKLLKHLRKRKYDALREKVLDPKNTEELAAPINELSIFYEILTNINEALKDSGKLTIIETVKPPARDTLEPFLSFANFAIASWITETDRGWPKAVQPYWRNPPKSQADEPAFIATAQKTNTMVNGPTLS